MKLIIDIPKEFVEHFNTDRFEDSLARVASDIESFGFQLAGRYEKETITMLRKAIKNGTPLPEHHGRLIDADELLDANIDTFSQQTELKIKFAPTIIEGSESE